MDYVDSEFKSAYIDAIDGTVYTKQNQLIPLTATTRNYGEVDLKNYSVNGISFLSSEDNRIKIYQNLNDMTYDWKSELIPTTTDPTTWDNSDAWVLSKQALYTTEIVDQQLNSKLGITFPEIKVGTIYSPNAFAIHDGINNNITVGMLNHDPNGANLALFDLIAHELGHHVVFEHISYDPEYQNAVLHEGLADIIADYIENSILPDGTDWIMGNDDEEIKNYLDRDHTKWYCFDDTQPAHENSKAISHWFYAITNGIPGTSIQSIGEIEVSKNLALEAMYRIGDPLAGIHHFKYQTLVVAKEMFGENSAEYNSVVEAWARVCVDEQCSSDNEDLIITDYQNYTLTKQYFGGNIIVESGGTLNILNSDFFLKDGKFIKVKSGGKIEILASKINTCDGQGAWNGIILEEGSSIDLLNAFIYNARIGIDFQGPLQSFDFGQVHIVGNELSEIGLKFGTNNNYPVIHSYTYNIKDFGDITNCQKGILSEQRSGNKNIRKANINNCQIGMQLNGNKNEILYSDFNNCDQGIFIDDSRSNDIMNNSFNHCNFPVNINNSYGNISENNITGNFNTGINCESSGGMIEENRIGTSSLSGSKGIRCYQSDGVIIGNNPGIYADMGISIIKTAGVIAGNIIEVQSASAGVGIYSDQSDQVEIFNNYLNVEYGFSPILSRLTSNENIHNNQITFNTRSNIASAAFRGSSNHGSQFYNNIVISPYNVPAVSLNNSMGNTISCNDIKSGLKGIEIKYNADMHTITGNILNTGKDIEIRSVIGMQSHHGNLFIGGTAEAIGLSDMELTLSQFTVNPNIAYHLPTNIISDGEQWFEIDYNPNPFICTDVIGPDTTSTKSLCVYWEQLKRIKDTLPDRFFINVFHLLYRAQKDTSFHLPDCIRLDKDLAQLCGVTKAAEVFADLTRPASDAGRRDSLRRYARQYFEATDASTKIKLRATIEDILIDNYKANSDSSNILKNSLRLDSLYTTLDEVKCDSLIYLKWKDILKLYIHFLQRDSVRIEDRSDVLDYSRHCADRYGDAVYLARSMAETFSSEDFHQYDDCIDLPPARRLVASSTDDVVQDIRVAPNPTGGLIRIDFSGSFTGKLIVSDMAGRIWLTRTYNSVNHIEADLSPNPGMQYIQLLTDRGESMVYKVIVIK